MLRARAPRARAREHPKPEDPRVEELRRVGVGEAVEGRRLRPRMEPKI
jgi:hypothetical protein